MHPHIFWKKVAPATRKNVKVNAAEMYNDRTLAKILYLSWSLATYPNDFVHAFHVYAYWNYMCLKMSWLDSDLNNHKNTVFAEFGNSHARTAHKFTKHITIEPISDRTFRPIHHLGQTLYKDITTNTIHPYRATQRNRLRSRVKKCVHLCVALYMQSCWILAHLFAQAHM